MRFIAQQESNMKDASNTRPSLLLRLRDVNDDAAWSFEEVLLQAK